MFFYVFLVHFGFLVGAFGGALPVAAEFVVEQVEGGEVGPFCAGKFFHYQFHGLFVHALAQVGVFFAGGGAGHHVGFFDLPLNVGGAVEAFSSERGSGEEIVDAAIETQGVLIGAPAAVAAAGFLFGIDGGSK